MIANFYVDLKISKEGKEGGMEKRRRKKKEKSKTLLVSHIREWELGMVAYVLQC